MQQRSHCHCRYAQATKLLGGLHPNHFISTKTFRKEYFSENIKQTSDIERGHEVKNYVLTFKDVPSGKGPYCVLCGHP